MIDKIYFDGPTGIYSEDPLCLELQAYKSANLDNFASKATYQSYGSTTASFCVSVFDSCNLDCAYCFNKGKNNSVPDMQVVFNFLDACFAAFPRKQKYFVDLSGKGEPLLYLSKIFEIKDYCIRKQNDLKVEVLVQFVSNGTLLEKEIAVLLQKHGILFGVSVDGNRAVHDSKRKTKDGKPTYDAILENVKAIPNRDYVGAACTFAESDFSFVESIKNLSKTFKTIAYKPVRSRKAWLNQVSMSRWASRYDELVSFLLKTASKGDLKYLWIILNGDDYFGKFIRRIFLGTKVVNRCDGGLSRLALDSSGFIYPCPAAFEFPDLCLGSAGSIDFSKIEHIFREQLSNPECKNCDVRHLCGGECLVQKRLSKGNNQAMCYLKRHLIKLAVSFSVELANRNRQSYQLAVDFCAEVASRGKRNKQLYRFLEENPGLSFTDGKQVFDSLNKVY